MKSLLFTLNDLQTVMLLIISAVALYQDIRYMKVYNKLNLFGVISGLVFSAVSGNLINSLFGMLLPLVFIPLFMLNMMGAGDIKFFCVLGSWTGYPDILSIMAAAVILNGGVAIIYMLARKNGVQLFKEFFLWLKIVFLTRTIEMYPTQGKEQDVFPYMIGIFLTVCMYCMNLI